MIWQLYIINKLLDTTTPHNFINLIERYKHYPTFTSGIGGVNAPQLLHLYDIYEWHYIYA